MKNTLLIAAIVAAFPASTAIAEEERKGGYAGASIGQVILQDFCEGSDPASACEDSDIGLRAFGGWRFNDFVAAELGGTIAHDNIGFLVNGNRKVDADYTAFDLGLLGQYPINNSFAVLGRMGITRWDVNVSDNCCEIGGNTVNIDADGVDFTVGAGIQFSANSFSLRAEWSRIIIDETVSGVFEYKDTDFIFLSAIYNF